MQPGFDFRNGFSCDICLDLQPIPRPQETFVFRTIRIQGRFYPDKGTKSTTGIGGVQALSACSFVIASGWFQQRSATRHWELHSALT